MFKLECEVSSKIDSHPRDKAASSYFLEAKVQEDVSSLQGGAGGLTH